MNFFSTLLYLQCERGERVLCTWRSGYVLVPDLGSQLHQCLPLSLDDLVVPLTATLRADRGQLRRDAPLLVHHLGAEKIERF